MAKLSDIFTLQMGKTPARAKDEYWNNGDNNWVSISDLSTYNKYVGDTKETISDLAVKDSGIKPVPADTVIMSFKLTLGKTAITVKPTFTNEAIMAFIPNGNYPVCPSYFYHFFGGRDWSKGTNRAVMGVTLNKATLGEIDVATPSLEEQTKIAEHLDRVDELISYRKQQLSKLDELVKSRFIELFGKVGTDDKGWGLSRLGNCCIINPKKSDDNRLTQDLMVSFVPMPSVSEKGEIDASEIKSYNDVKSGFTYFAENDVLFAKITPCMENGKGAVAKGLSNGIGFGSTEFHVLRPINGTSDPHWLYAVTTFKQFRIDAANNMTGSAGQRRVPASFLEAYKVSVPPIDLQNEFATFVEQTDKLKFEVKEALEKLEILKKSLMQQYFG